ncbi:PIN domain-containing protein [Laspinema olomoucense]|uniref:PIN domain-containing protein n=1 Tax=Laspinema olomoucense D3b TaxID=2953688 RepID=A0ABT2NG44_9CYAN|nr:PIN domain-containing protein [Laspinema sp. D3b]MCT7981657.1 PIN domain-containing protein [Laspinema sp. D3b]
MAIADANIILRYILNDHEILSAKAAEIIENNRVNLPIEVACEVVFVLQKVYQVEREKIQEVLSHLIEEDLVCLEKPKLLLKALEVYSETKFDFVDCLLVSYCKVYQESIFTFDKKLENHLNRGT